MNESEQAQAIERMRRHAELYPEDERPDMLKSHIRSLLEIVDSKAQKIATLTQCNETQATQIERQFRGKRRVYEICMANIRRLREQRKLLSQKIAEQAKGIEILREVTKYDKYANLAHIMKRPKDVSVFTHKKAEWLQKLHDLDEANK